MQVQILLYCFFFPLLGNNFILLGGIYRRVSSFFKVRIFLDCVWKSLTVVSFILRKLWSDFYIAVWACFSLTHFVSFHIFRKDNDRISMFYFYSYFALFYFLWGRNPKIKNISRFSAVVSIVKESAHHFPRVFYYLSGIIWAQLAPVVPGCVLEKVASINRGSV